jgi:hypothetical protein
MTVGIAKTADDVTYEQRNAWGFPPVEVTAHERSSQTSRVDVDNSNRKNDALPWVFVAGIMGAIALGGWIASLDRISDVNDRAARSEERADLLQYYVMELDGKLMQRQLIKPEESFSGQMRQREQAKQQAEQPKE